MTEEPDARRCSTVEHSKDLDMANETRHPKDNAPDNNGSEPMSL